MKRIAILAATFAALTATAEVNYSISGELPSSEGDKIEMMDYDTNSVIDSTTVVNGKFTLTGTYDRPAYVRVESRGQGMPFASIVLDEGVKLNFDNHLTQDRTGVNAALHELKEAEDAGGKVLDALSDSLRKANLSQEEFQAAWGPAFTAQMKILRKRICELAKANPDNGAGEAVIMSAQFIFETPDEWDAFYATLSPYLKERNLTRKFNDRFTTLRSSMPGKPFIDISGKNPEGETASLSDYAGKGKYVLVDFWASWCGPCRQEIGNTLSPLYDKYGNDPRFTIVGIDVWDNAEDARKAITDLGMHWPQIFTEGTEATDKYGINGIPMVMLLGPDGTIIERDLYGEYLTRKIDELLGK